MYHRIVGRVVRRSFAHLNEGNYKAVIAQFDPHIDHYFSGSHALGGSRHSIPTVEQWYRRLFAVFDDLHFSVRRTVIQGLPWHTSVAVNVDIKATLRSSQPYSNELAMFIDLKWGRITHIRMYEDTQKLTAALLDNAAHGVIDASAVPITD